LTRPGQPGAPPRRQDINLLRLLCALGIVWFHASAHGVALAYSALVALLVLSVMLGGSGSAPAASGGALRRRALRFLLPWLVWFGIYGGVNLLRGGDFLPPGPGLWLRLMAGPSIHLWYLPFMFLCLCGADVLKALAGARASAWLGGGSALVLVASAAWWRPVSLGWPYPLLQWADAAAPVALGLCLQQAAALPQRALAALKLAILGGAVATAFFNPIGVSYAIGFAACLLIASGRTARWAPVNLAPLSDLSYGIYLSHALVFYLLLTWAHLPGDLLPAAIFLVAAALVALLRWLCPGLRRVWS